MRGLAMSIDRSWQVDRDIRCKAIMTFLQVISAHGRQVTRSRLRFSGGNELQF